MTIVATMVSKSNEITIVGITMHTPQRVKSLILKREELVNSSNSNTKSPELRLSFSNPYCFFSTTLFLRKEKKTAHLYFSFSGICGTCLYEIFERASSTFSFSDSTHALVKFQWRWTQEMGRNFASLKSLLFPEFFFSGNGNEYQPLEKVLLPSEMLLGQVCTN